MTLLEHDPDSDQSLAERFAALTDDLRAELLEGIGDDQAEHLLTDWGFWARPDQLEPEPLGDWDIWAVLGGRGSGKTRTGSETTNKRVREGQATRVALVARTAADGRDVMVEGPSGIMATSPPSWRPRYEPSKRRLTWPNGVQGTVFSADKPDLLRGPEHDWVWADEVAAWRYGDDAWANLEMGLRVGRHPQVLLTTTPRPVKWLRALLDEDSTHLTGVSTYRNAANLPPKFLQRLLNRYEGTRLGAQELHAVLLMEAEGALWSRDLLDANRRKGWPELPGCVVGVDPDAGAGTTGIIVAGFGEDRHGYVLDDVSVEGGTPAEWAAAAIAAYWEWEADAIVAEVNNGGAMVTHTIHSIDPSVPVRTVHAQRGKYARAEPVSALYEQRRVHHVGFLAELEDQLTDWEPGKGIGSPDRLDALVWALTHLMVTPRKRARLLN